jgi:N-carbamoyl-L-amino-acid hydrolase
MPLTLDTLNAARTDEALQLLDGLYEHSPWVAQSALAYRPFRSLGHLKHAMAAVVHDSGIGRQVDRKSVV